MAVYEAIERAQNGNFKGGTDVIATVENGGVGLGKISAEGTKYKEQVQEIQTDRAGRDRGHPRHGQVAVVCRRLAHEAPALELRGITKRFGPSSPTTGSTSTFAPARSTRCSARTARQVHPDVDPLRALQPR